MSIFRKVERNCRKLLDWTAILHKFSVMLIIEPMWYNFSIILNKYELVWKCTVSYIYELAHCIGKPLEVFTWAMESQDFSSSTKNPLNHETLYYVHGFFFVCLRQAGMTNLQKHFVELCNLFAISFLNSDLPKASYVKQIWLR